MIKLTFLKKLVLIRQANQKSVIFVIICIFLNKGFKYQLFPSNRCPDLLIVSMKFSNIYILNIQNDDYHCIISGISKSETIKLLQNIDLTKKNGTLKKNKYQK